MDLCFANKPSYLYTKKHIKAAQIRNKMTLFEKIFFGGVFWIDIGREDLP